MADIYKFTKDGNTIWPATASDAIVHPQTRASLSSMMNVYNVTSLYALRSLEMGISKLNTELTAAQKKIGVRLEFTNASGIFEAWEFYGGGYSFDNINGWRQADSGIIQEIEKTVFPISATFSLSPALILVGTTTDITQNWKVMRKDENITLSATKSINGEIVDGVTKTISMNPSSNGTTDFTFLAQYKGMSTSIKKTIQAAHRSYYGIVSSDWLPTENTVKNLSHVVLQGSRSLTWSNIGLNNEKICFAYPQYFGSLTSIKDGNNFEYLSGSYTRTDNVAIDSIPYYTYTLTRPTTITDFKQIYN